MAGLESHKLQVSDRDEARVGYEDGLSVLSESYSFINKKILSAAKAEILVPT